MYFPYCLSIVWIGRILLMGWNDSKIHCGFTTLFFLEDAGRELPPKTDPFKVFLVDIRVFSQGLLLVKAVVSVIS